VLIKFIQELKKNKNGRIIKRRKKFSPTEDRIILETIKQHGTKWHLITAKLQGRNEVMIRNRYYAKLRKNEIAKA